MRHIWLLKEIREPLSFFTWSCRSNRGRQDHEGSHLVQTPGQFLTVTSTSPLKGWSQ